MKQRFTGAALVAVSLVALGACGSSGGSDSSSGDATTTTAAAKADDSAFAAKANAACASAKTVYASLDEQGKAVADESVSTEEADGESQVVKLQEEGLTETTKVAGELAAAGASSADEQEFVTTFGKLPAAYTALNEAGAPLYSSEELSSAEAAEVEKAIDKPTDEVTDGLAKSKEQAEKLGLDDCVAMIDAMDSTV